MMACHECQKHLAAYLHNELPPHQRRRLAYHLDDCPACYLRYIQERDLADELRRGVPLIGREETPRFDRVWSAIQADMARPRRTPTLYRARYGLAMLLLALLGLFPWALGGRHFVLAAPPTQPAPLTRVIEDTPGLDAPGAVGTAIALSVTAGDENPTPEAKPRRAPEPGATAAPR